MPCSLRKPLFARLPCMAPVQVTQSLIQDSIHRLKQVANLLNVEEGGEQMSAGQEDAENVRPPQAEAKPEIRPLKPGFVPIRCNQHAVVMPFVNEEVDMDDIQRVIGAELSEPYSIYTYRYFIANWPDLCLLVGVGLGPGTVQARDKRTLELVGAIVCKVDTDPNRTSLVYMRGYIAMLAVTPSCRGKGIGTLLVQTVIDLLRTKGCKEIMLETEVSNSASLCLYDRLGFCVEERMHHYYLNGGDAFRLRLFLDTYVELPDEKLPEEEDMEMSEENSQAAV